MAQMVKNLPAMQETQVWSLGWKDPLEEGMASYSSVLVWRILWTEEPGSLQTIGLQRVGHDWGTNTFTFSSCLSQGHHQSWGGSSGRGGDGLVTQLCPTLCDRMDCSPQVSTVHGISQARILEWAAISFSRGSFLTQGSNPCLLLRQVL